MLLGRPNFARDLVCFLLADLPGRVIVVRANVIGGVVGGVHGPLHRPGAVVDASSDSTPSRTIS